MLGFCFGLLINEVGEGFVMLFVIDEAVFGIFLYLIILMF